MILCVFVTLVSATEVEPPSFHVENDELRQYLMTAADNHPALQARYAEWRAALERIPQARSLDDPMFTYTQFVQSDTDYARLMVEQKFPWFGTLLVQGKQAAAEADAALERFYSERNRVFADVKRAYFEYAFLSERTRVAESQIEVLEYMTDIVRSKLALGMASEDELLRTSIAKTQVQDLLTSLAQMRPSLSARLAETLGQDPGEDLPIPQAAPIPRPIPPVEEVRTRIHIANPELRALDFIIESRQKQAKIAQRKWVPDVTLGFEYAFMKEPDQPRAPISTPSPTPIGGIPPGGASAMTATFPSAMAGSDDTKDDIMISLSFNLPIWYPRIRAGIREARLMEEAATHDKRRSTLALDSAAASVVYEVIDAQRRYHLYGDSLFPQAKATYESLVSRYSVDAEGSSFLDVLNSLQQLLDFQLEQARAARDWQIAAADLEYLTGGPWAEQEVYEAGSSGEPASSGAAK